MSSQALVSCHGFAQRLDRGIACAHGDRAAKVPSPAPKPPLDNAAGLFGHEIFSSKPQSAAGLYQLVVIREQVINGCVVCRVCH